MVNIQVGDVPEQIRDAQRMNNVVLLQRLETVGGGFSSSADDAAAELAALRTERDDQISAAT